MAGRHGADHRRRAGGGPDGNVQKPDEVGAKQWKPPTSARIFTPSVRSNCEQMLEFGSIIAIKFLGGPHHEPAKTSSACGGMWITIQLFERPRRSSVSMASISQD
jgi:hypothetical protein